MYNTNTTGDTMSNLDPTHSFNVEDAIKYGSIEKALIVKEIRGMQIYKLRNERKNPKGWVYYSREALAAKFPYMKPRSIARWLNELVKDGHLEVTIQNKLTWDRTKSYRLSGLSTSLGQNGQWSGQNGQCHAHKVANDTGQNGRTIPPPSSLTTSHSRKGTKIGDNSGRRAVASGVKTVSQLMAEGRW